MGGSPGGVGGDLIRGAGAPLWADWAVVVERGGGGGGGGYLGQELLSRTHRRDWGQPWAWERWVRREPPPPAGPGQPAGRDGGDGDGGDGDCLLQCARCAREGLLG